MQKPWHFEAPLCREVGTEIFYPENEDRSKSDTSLERINNAKNICLGCRHRTACAEWAIYNERHGIWGGLTVRDRGRIRKQRKIILPEEKVA